MTKRDGLNPGEGGLEKSAEKSADQALQKSVDKSSVEKLTDEEKKTLQKRQENGSSSVSGAFAGADGKGGLPSAKDVLGQFAHGEDAGIRPLEGHVSLQDNSALSGVSDFSEALGRAISDSQEQVQELLESGKDAVGVNDNQVEREIHQPNGDMSTLPCGVQNLRDVVHEGLGAVKGLAGAIDAMGRALTPEGIKKQAEELGRAAIEGGTQYVRVRVDPIGALEHDLKKAEQMTKGLIDWATNRSAETFGERGADAGELMPLLEAGQGFIARKRSGLTESMKVVNERDVAKLLRMPVKEVRSLSENEILEYARRLDVDLTKIEKVGDPPRMPINWQYAGRTYKFEESELMKQDPGKAMQLAAKYPEGVRFNEKGFPDFSPYVAELEDRRKIGVPITLTGNRKEDFKCAT